MKTRCFALLASALLLTLNALGAELQFDLRPKGFRLSVASESGRTSDGILRLTSLGAGATRASALSVGDKISFWLFQDVEIVLTLKERTESPLGGEAFLAAENDADALTAVVMQDANGITVNYTDCKNSRVYTIVSTEDGVTVREINPNAGVREPCQTAVPELPDAPKSGLKFSTSSADQSSTLIDVLVAFDRNAVTWAKQNGGGITNFATMAVQKMNTAMANTGFSSKFRFRLVGAMAVDASGGSDFDGTLDAATDGSDSWASIKAMRDAVGADTVTVLIDTGSAYGTTGLGWSLDDREIASFSENAYNVCSVRAVAQSDTMTHETGHNLGAGHSDTQSSGPGPQRYTYSSGYYFTVNSTQYHTIMAYGDKNGDGYSDATAIPYFSSPDYTYEGVAVGDATHDNVRTINQTYAAASQWRAQKIAMSYDVCFSPEGGSMFTDSISVTLTPGKAGLPIRYTLDGSTPTASSTLYDGAITLTQTTTIRAVTITDGVAGPVFEATYSKSDLGAGVDAPQLVWRTSSDYPWTFQATETYDGVDALQSTDGGGYWDQPSWISTTVTGPTVVSFVYKTRCYAGYAAFTVSIDGSVAYTDETSHPDDWTLGEVTIPTGSHTVKFTFEINGGRTCGSGGVTIFNGAWLDQVRFDALSSAPTISPASTMDESTATTFTGSTTVTLTPPAGKSGTLYYTLDDTDPAGEGGKIYTGPISLTKSTIVRSVFVEGGKDPSVEVKGLYLERHAVRPGEWTTDVDGVKAAAAKDGRLIAIVLAHYTTCSWCRDFYPVATSAEFLSWAEANGVYLVTADETLHCDTANSESWFWTLYSSGSVGYPAFQFALPSAPTTSVGSGTARNYNGNYKIGTVAYDDTVEALIAGVASILGESPLSAPTASSPALISAFPVSVTLSNPNGSGTIYYTLDGTEPTKANGKAYTGAITISKPTTLKAAVWPSTGCSSPVLVLPFKTFGEVLGTSGITWSTGGDYAWGQDADSDATLTAPYVSGKTYSSWLQGTVSGKGKLVYTLKLKSYSWQNTIALCVNDVQDYSYGYSSNWGTVRTQTLTNEVATAGTTTFKWTYAVAGSDYNYSGCGAWLSDVKWISDNVVAGGETPYTPSGWSTPITVNNDWLIAKGLAKEGDSAATVAAKLAGTGANGLPRYQSYILGMEPESDVPANEQLKVSIDGFDANGLPVIRYEPTPNDAAKVTYKTQGKESISSKDNWIDVTDQNKSDMHFYRVKAIIAE